jgi:hypothetical protein
MERASELGLARPIGVSNFGVDELDAVFAMAARSAGSQPAGGPFTTFLALSPLLVSS